jgi:enolase
MDIALDVAATHFFGDGLYSLEGRRLTSAGMCDLLESWISGYGIVSIEDPLAEDDWEAWKNVTTRLGSRVRLVGDDLFVTNLSRLNRGIREGAANAVLVKMNQIGTLTETFAVIDRAREVGYEAVVSGRSGGGSGRGADQDRVRHPLGTPGEIQPAARNREMGAYFRFIVPRHFSAPHLHRMRSMSFAK